MTVVVFLFSYKFRKIRISGKIKEILTLNFFWNMLTQFGTYFYFILSPNLAKQISCAVQKLATQKLKIIKKIKKNFQKLGKKFLLFSLSRNQLNSQFLSVELIQPGLHGGKWGHSSESALDCPFFCNQNFGVPLFFPTDSHP